MARKEDFYARLAAEIRAGQAEPTRLNIGATIRALREQRKMPGVELCRLAGDLDPKTLNALEKGRIRNPSIRTLQSVSRGLGIPVSELFGCAESSGDTFHQGSQKGFCQIDFPHWGVRVVSFTPLVRDFFCGKILFGARRTLDGTQFKQPRPMYLSLIVGRLEVQVGMQKTVLREGENLFFHGNLRHSFYNPLEREAVLLLVTAPSFL